MIVCIGEVLVLFGVTDRGVVDVDSGKNGEDVGLQEGDQDFEDCQEDEHHERQDAHRHQEQLLGFSQHQRFGEQAERDQQDVASEHVGHQTNCQRERGHDDGRDELDATNKWLQSRWNSGWPQQALEIAHSLVLDARADEHNPDQQRQHQGDRNSCRCWHLQPRDDAWDIAQEDKEEQAQQERSPTKALLTQRLHHDAFLDELDRNLSEVSSTRRGLLGIGPAGEEEQDDADQCGGDGDERDLVERWEDVLPTQDFVNRRELESEHVVFRFSREEFRWLGQ